MAERNGFSDPEQQKVHHLELIKKFQSIEAGRNIVRMGAIVAVAMGTQAAFDESKENDSAALLVVAGLSAIGYTAYKSTVELEGIVDSLEESNEGS